MDRSDFRRRVRFALGLIGIFLGTVELTLGAFAAGAALVPGWSSTVVASGSMEPALQRGDVVVFRDNNATSQDSTGVEVGDVLVFDSGTGSTIHRVIRINRDGTVITQGDANQSPDSTAVTTDMTAGSGFMVIPWIGLPNLWLVEDNLVLLFGFLFISVVMLQSSTLAWDPENDPWQGTATVAGRPGWWLDTPISPLSPSLLGQPRRSSLLQRGRQCG